MGVRWRIALATPLALATAMRWRQKTRNACFSPDEPPARRGSGSFVKEVERRLVEAPAILLGNGNGGVALGMDELVPTVNVAWCGYSVLQPDLA